MMFDSSVYYYGGLLNRHMYMWRKKAGMTDEEGWKKIVEKLDSNYHEFKERLHKYTKRNVNLDLYIIYTLASYPDFADKFDLLIDYIVQERMKAL